MAASGSEDIKFAERVVSLAHIIISTCIGIGAVGAGTYRFVKLCVDVDELKTEMEALKGNVETIQSL